MMRWVIVSASVLVIPLSTLTTALISVSSTIGVVVPPSLVLILLGDAMMNAHTEASNLPGYLLGGQHIINTQDVFHAALVLLLVALCAWVLDAFEIIFVIVPIVAPLLITLLGDAQQTSVL